MLAKLKPSIRPLPPGLAFFSPTVLIATWFGSGRIRPASGTIGTLAALPFGIVIGAIGGPAGLALAALILFFIGKAAAEAYGKKSGSSDDQAIVVDEAVGLWIAGIPAAAAPGLWIIAFILFRFFDIYKPWPASFFDERKNGGFDVMMDDVIAGIFAFFGVATLSLFLVS